MKWVFTAVLLISLGLNLSLGWRLINDDGDAPPRGRGGWERSGDAMRDSSSWHRRLDRRFDRLAGALALDADQRAAFRELHQSGVRDMHRRSREVDAGRQRLRAQVSAGTIVPDSVRAAMAELSRRQAVLDSLAADKLLQELELLTPVQRREYLRLLPLDRLGGPGRRGPGAGGGRGGHDLHHGRFSGG